MDPNLHQKQGVTHLKKVLQYAPMVANGNEAVVHLTREDWYVVADTLFRMNTPREFLPNSITDFRLSDDHQTIELYTEELQIRLEMF
ncbi:MAG: hypothetical protein OXD43_04900 [Bacteroidetes bacterium]|nr:hypothetical protein [Bacteroidota bacterium]